MNLTSIRMKPEPVGTAQGRSDSAPGSSPTYTPQPAYCTKDSALTNDGLVSTSQERRVPLKCAHAYGFSLLPTCACQGGKGLPPHFFLIKRQSRCTTNQLKQNGKQEMKSGNLPWSWCWLLLCCLRSYSKKFYTCPLCSCPRCTCPRWMRL